MKKSFLLLVIACVFISCSQDTELLTDESQKQLVNEEVESNGIQLRGLVEDFFDSRNQIPLYEYLSYSGSTIVNVYYTIEDKGFSFTDPKTNQFFTARKKICTIAKTAPYNISMPCLQFIYNAYTQTYSLIARSSAPGSEGDYVGDGDYIVKPLGFVINIFYSSYPEKFNSGLWGYLTLYNYGNSNQCRRALAENVNAIPSDPNTTYGQTFGAVGLR